MSATITAEQQQAIANFLDGRHIPAGLRIREWPT